MIQATAGNNKNQNVHKNSPSFIKKNYTAGMEIYMLVPDLLLYKNMDISPGG